MGRRMMKLFGLLFWSLLAGVQLQAAWTGSSLIPLLLSAESALIAFRLRVQRREASSTVSSGKHLAAWLSLFAPLAMQGANASRLGNILGVAGLLLTLWALWTLGPAFGIAPADRGLVAAGPYRFLRHPMYAGALLNALGFLDANLNLWNGIIFGLVVASATMRIRWEEQVIQDYRSYTASVPFRLIPGIW